MKLILDAEGKKLGRIASEAAAILAGKNSVKYERHKTPELTVHVKNIGRLALAERKGESKLYQHSGWRGGLKTTTRARFAQTRGLPELMRRTIFGMLPKNKLRGRMIKNLIITE